MSNKLSSIQSQRKPVQDIYQHYLIPSNLAEHMLQTAALGQIICQHWQQNKTDLQQSLVLTTLLLHDMGNLIKFKLDKTANKQQRQVAQLLTADQNWQQQQQAMIAKYGSSCEQANSIILQELGLNKAAQLLKRHNFDRLHTLIDQPGHWQEKIIFYCDLRFTPFGLSSVPERIQDLKERYQSQNPNWRDAAIVRQRLDDSLQLEASLNQYTKIDLKHIADSSIKPLVQQLRQYPITVKV